MQRPELLKDCSVTAEFRRIAVLGLGYVGLPIALTFASRRFEVVGVDINPRVVAMLRAGRAPISEPGLDTRLRSALADGHFRIAQETAPSDVYIIAVPTPCRSDRTPDIDSVVLAAVGIAPHLRKGALVIIESTCPVGTTRLVCEELSRLRPDLTLPHVSPEAPDIFVGYCPERVLPGRTLHELVTSDRVVGGISPACTRRAAALYREISAGHIQETTAETAEMVKLVENAYRDVNIAFANEVANMSESLGLNARDIIGYANRHQRVDILAPGPGVGGHCIPVDPWFLISSLPGDTRLLRAAREVNDQRSHRVVQRVLALIDRTPVARLVVFGLAYKPDIEDVRESPAVKIIKSVAESRTMEIVIFDPHVHEVPPELATTPSISFVRHAPLLGKNDAIVLLVAHGEFKNIDFSTVPRDRICDEVGLLLPDSGVNTRDARGIP